MLVLFIIMNWYKENVEIILCYELFRILIEFLKLVYLRLSDGFIINYNNLFKFIKMGFYNF